MRWAKKRDANETEIVAALKMAAIEHHRFDDFDLAVRHCDGHGLMLEIKVAKGKLREKQLKLQAIFGDRYVVARDPESALAACGIQVRRGV
jgi:hypothetical protein